MNITLIDELGKGGEATVYNIAEDENMVAKIYHQPTPDREAKLRAMLLNPPEQPTTHVAIAWPTALVYQSASGFVASTLEILEATNLGQFVGFLMLKITTGRALFHIYNPALRKQLPYPFGRKALHRTAYNLCAVVAKIHAKGYVIGDVNESNILVNQKALVTIVDCDSFQVKSEGGHIHRCQVGKPEYTPPELQGMRLGEVDRTIQHDLFGLAVLLFQLLMEGYHPFTGVLQTPQSVGRVDLYAIREGLFPYTNPSRINPPPSAPPYEWLHKWLQKAFIRCFVTKRQKILYRPTAQQWQEVLHQAERSLQQCSHQPHHHFANHLPTCPFCKKISTSLTIPHSLNRKRHVTTPPTPRPFVKLKRLFTWNINNTEVRNIAFSADGQTFAATDWDKDKAVVFWNQGQQAISWSNTKDICFSPQQPEILLMGSSTQGLAIWNVQTNSYKYRRFEKCPTGGVHNVTFSPTGQHFACYQANKGIYVWQLAGTALPTYQWQAKTPEITSLAFSRNSQFLITGGTDRYLIWLNIIRGKQIRTLKTPSAINQVTCSPIDNLVVTAHNDETIRVWNLLTGQLIRTLDKHLGNVTTIAFSLDGRFLVSGGTDKNIFLWRIADGTLLQTLRTHSERVNRVAFSPDGKFLASAGDDGRIYMWGTAVAQQWAAMQQPNPNTSHQLGQKVPSGIKVKAGYEPKLTIRPHHWGFLEDVGLIAPIFILISTLTMIPMHFIIDFDSITKIVGSIWWGGMTLIPAYNFIVNTLSKVKFVLSQKYLTIHYGPIQGISTQSFAWTTIQQISCKRKIKSKADYAVYLNQQTVLVDRLSADQANYIVAELNKFRQPIQTTQPGKSLAP